MMKDQTDKGDKE